MDTAWVKGIKPIESLRNNVDLERQIKEEAEAIVFVYEDVDITGYKIIGDKVHFYNKGKEVFDVPIEKIKDNA